jgi:hypothetical protein
LFPYKVFRGWTAERDGRIIQVKERRVIKEGIKGIIIVTHGVVGRKVERDNDMMYKEWERNK